MNSGGKMGSQSGDVAPPPSSWQLFPRLNAGAGPAPLERVTRARRHGACGACVVIALQH